ncbi:MAG: hypothetical protein II515_03565 [Desulfovibrio sp.]|nr:hypothetical protein [Desulfovibrio sp.]
MHPVLVYLAAKAVTLGAYGCWRVAKKRRRERELWRRAGPLYDLHPDGSVARPGEDCGKDGTCGKDEACGDGQDRAPQAQAPVRKGGAG